MSEDVTGVHVYHQPPTGLGAAVEVVHNPVGGFFNLPNGRQARQRFVYFFDKLFQGEIFNSSTATGLRICSVATFALVSRLRLMRHFAFGKTGAKEAPPQILVSMTPCK